MLTSVVHVLHNSARDQKGADSWFRRHITPSVLPPRDLPRPPWPARCGRFLIANPRLEIVASPTKQTIGARPNRERIALPSPAFSRHLRTIEFRPEISNSNIRIIKNSPKCPRNNTYAFSNRNKTAHFGDLPVSFRQSAAFKHENSVPSRLSATHPNRLESERKWQSPLKLFTRNQPLVKSL